MRHKIIKSTRFFQDLLASYFQGMTQQIVETLLLLCVCHLFGLYNPNQVADALRLPKAGLYRRIGSLSLYHAKALNLRLRCAMALDFIKAAENKSASTQSRQRITLSVDDTTCLKTQRRYLIVQTTTRKNTICLSGVRTS